MVKPGRLKMQIEAMERKKTGVNRLEDLSGDSVFYNDNSGEILRAHSTGGRGGRARYRAETTVKVSFSVNSQ